MVLGFIIGYSVWCIGGCIDYIPRVTPFFRFGGSFIFIGQILNFLEEVPWIRIHPLLGDSGLMFHHRTDGALSIIGVTLLVFASLLVIIELSRARIELAVKSTSLKTSLDEQKNLLVAMQAISEEVHSRTGEEFFQVRVRNISDAFNVKYTFIAELIGHLLAIDPELKIVVMTGELEVSPNLGKVNRVLRKPIRLREFIKTIQTVWLQGDLK